jgi:hypothetical protein
MLSGCAALETAQGQRSFLAVTGQAEVTYTDQETLTLWVDGQKVADIPPIGRDANWTHFSRWEGSYQDSYLYVQCDEAHWRTGERQCQVKQVSQCHWDVARKRCESYAQKTPLATLQVAAPASVYLRGKPSRLTGVIDADQVVLNFDGKPTAKIPALSILEQSGQTRLFRGRFGQDEAEVFCRVYQTGYDNYQVPTFVCSAQKDVNGGSGRGFELARIGEAVIPWNQGDYAALRYLAERFYTVDKWPRLNPNKPKEVPEPSTAKSKYAMLLEQEWKAWTN